MLRTSTGATAVTAVLALTGGLLAAAPTAAWAAPSPSAAVVINEVYGGGGNTGAPIRNDFIELYNASPAAVDVSGWSVQYASSTGTSWARTNLVGSIPAGKTYVVKQGAGANTAVPEVTGDATGSIAMSGTAGKVALVSNQTALPTTCTASTGASPCSARTDVADFVGYGSANDYAGSGPTPTLSNTTSATRSESHANTANNAADFTTGAPSPCGLACSDTPPPPPPPPAEEKTIAEIQGTGTTSPLTGSVLTRGVVTAAYPGTTGSLRGFYLQTAGSGGSSDATPGASDGVFVFVSAGIPASVIAGAYLQVEGSVGEFSGQTQLSAVAAGITDLGAAPAPVTATTTAGWPGSDTDREALEGMLYRPTGAYTVTNTFATNRFGDVGLAAGTTPLLQRTEVERPGPAASSPVDADNKARSVVLDDGYSYDFTARVGGSATGALLYGDRTPAYLVGTPAVVGAPVTFSADVVLGQSFGSYRFQPTAPVDGATNAGSPAAFGATRTSAPDAAKLGAADIKVASFNVLNYFTTLAEGRTGCTASFPDRDGSPNTASCSDVRGAYDAADLARQQAKEVRAINSLDADVVGLIEMENSAKLGEPVDESAATLVDALNADAGAGTWAYVPSSSELPDPAQRDFITNAVIYKPATATPVGASRALGAESDAGEAFDNAREPVAQAFAPAAGGDAFLFVVNHFKSKSAPTPVSSVTGTDNADSGDGQGFFNGDRVRQATALRDWIPTVLPTGTTSVVLAGDLNAYGMEDPVSVLTDAGYTSAEKRFAPGEYSYSFSGLSGSLDHVLLNAGALGRATGADIWNINSGESVAFEYSRYNTHGTDFHAPDAYRSSDHDPVVVGLAAESAPVPVQLLATNDFHGRLQANGAEAGAAVLAGAVKQLRAAQPNTAFAAAGDLVGASTFESFISKDKPTIDALNEAGLDVSSVGNHEFDAGYDDLVNRIMADHHPETNPQGGAEWEYLGANVRRKDTHDPALPETWMQEFDGIQVGFVGVVTEHLAELVSPAGIAELHIEPIVTATNRSAAQLKTAGADVVVMLVHEGAATTSYTSATDTANEFGAIVNAVSPDVDAIVSGHTHLAYNHAVPVQAWIDEGRAVTKRPVVSAGQYGTNLNQLLFQVDPETEDVVGLTQSILPLVKTPGYPADAATKAVVDKAVADAAVLGARVLGKVTGPFNRAKLVNGTTENRGGESTLGNLVAEVQRAQTGAQIAVMNPGGLRADLVGNNATGYPADLTFRQAANVQPFANTLVRMTLTGVQLKALLEQQWQPAGSSRPFLRLGLSEGFTYTYDPSGAAGSRIRQMWLNGAPVDPTSSYAVAVNSFLAAGGDNFSVLAAGTDRRDTGKVDLQSMVDHLAAAGTVSPDYTQRSVGVRFPAGAPADSATGSTVAFDLSSLAFSTAPDRKDATVDVSLGSVPVGSFPVDNTVGTAVFDEYGTASVSFVVPPGTAPGTYDVVVTGATTGSRTTVPVTVVQAPTTTTVTSSQSTSSLGAAVTLTAAVSGPIAGGTVQFLVDGSPSGGPVEVVDGQATRTLSSLSAGAHTVTAEYSGDAGTTGSSGSTAQAVQYVVQVVSPAAGSTIKAGSSVTVAFRLTDVNGVPVPDAEAAALRSAPCRVSVSVSGAQTLAPVCPNYNARQDRFATTWRTGKQLGPATVHLSVTYPGTATQTVQVPVTITK